MITPEPLLLIGALFHLGIALFHMGFARIFAWADTLAPLGFINRQLMPVMNHCLTYGFLAMAFLSSAYRSELTSTPLGHAILGAVTLFWVWRATLQVLYFRLRHWISVAFLALFVGAAALYGGALFLALQ